jgi:transcriptional regulator with XRE-family HTH domain
MNSKSPQAVDLIVGRNIRLHRLSKGISQTDLASKIGVTFQQVQKYEKGANRVGASRLSRIAQVLQIPVAALFDGGPGAGTEDRSDESPLALLSEPQALRLVKAFSKVEDSEVRRSMVSLLENLVRKQKRFRPRS